MSDKPYASDALSIVMPSYNEKDNLPLIVAESLSVLRGLSDRVDIVVVDDESHDGSWQVLQQLAVETPELTVVRNDKNRGCHPSTLVGWPLAKGSYRFFIPADGQVPPGEMGKLIDCAKSGCDVVYTWRVRRADALHRRLISGLYNLLTRLFFGIKVHDVDSASLLTERAVAAILPRVRSDSAFITVEILIEAQRQGLRIGEVPIDHRPRVHGQAHGINLKDLMKVPVSFLTMLWWFWGQKRRRAGVVSEQYRET